MDLYLVLDSSASIGSDNYDKAKKFLTDLVRNFTVGQDKVRVGFVIYESIPHLMFDLQKSFNNDDIVNRINSVVYLNSGGDAGGTIMFLVNTAFTDEHGARSIDCEIPRVALVLTDGELEGETSVSEAAKLARDKSIEIHAFGIGDSINNDGLLEIAGSGDRVHMIDNFERIKDAKSLISQGHYLGNNDIVTCISWHVLATYV